MTTICEPTLEDAKPLLEFDIAGRINLTGVIRPYFNKASLSRVSGWQAFCMKLHGAW